MTQPAIKDTKPPVKRRISPAVRKAINLFVTTGMSKTAAAKQCGITEGHLYNYLMKPHAKEYLEDVKAQFIQGVNAQRGIYKAQAYEVANELMHNGKSESIRMRAVEFNAGESKSGGVNIAVQVNNTPAQGYEYPRPNQKVYEIVDATDTVSLGQGDEAPVKQGD